MRKYVALLVAFLSAVTLGLVQVPNASAATCGNHTQSFSITGADSRTGTLTIGYKVCAVAANDLLLNSVLWETSPNFDANAVRIDLETSQGNWTEIGPAMGGSSATKDDMPNWWSREYVGGYGGQGYVFNGDEIRVRMYGVCAGTCDWNGSKTKFIL